MAVPYPGDGRVSYSQEKDHRVSIATRVIKAALDDSPTWETLLSQIAADLRLSLGDAKERQMVQDALLTAELDLEWTNVLVYESDHFRPPGASHDPVVLAPEQLQEVADAVLALGWPNPGHKPSRTIHECFVALGGRYRHCDVYWAMHKYLKGSRLRLMRSNWMLQDDVEAILADTSMTAMDRIEFEMELERELVADYVGWLGRAVQRERRYNNGRKADLYDKRRQLTIEAKANHLDDVAVAHGMGQAMYYRVIDPEGRNGQIAVLLRGRPSEDAARLLRTHEVGLIYREGNGFVELLT